MSSQTIIDRLVIECGLDPKKFSQGKKIVDDGLKEIQEQGKRTGETVEKAAKGGDSALMAMGKRVLTVAAIFKVLSYTTRNILEASRATYDLANASRHLGESARMLRNFENVAEIMGGTAEGARKSIQGLKQAVHDLAFNGQMSQQLVQLGRLGVQFQDSRGRAREFRDIYLDTATALQRQVASGQMSESDALMFAESAGFDPGLARAMVGGRDAAALALARQEARRQVGAEDIREATRAEQAITSAGQAEDTAFLAAGTAGGFGAAARVATGLEGAWTGGATGDMSVVWEGWKSAIEPVTTGLGDLADATKAAASNLWGMARTAALGKGPEAYRGAVMSSASKHGVPAHILAGVLGAESNWDPKAVSSAGAVGIAQFMPSTAAGMGFTPGVDPLTDIDMAAKYLAQLHGSFRRTGSDDADAWDRALMAYNGGERRVRTSGLFGDGSNSKPLTAETLNYPGRVYDAAAQWERGGGGGSNTTTVQIDQITVNTAATDANGIAAGIGEATRRKLIAAQADPGMQ